MLTTLYSGYANLIAGSTDSLYRELPINQATIASSLNSVSVIQTGYFTPTVSANHHFKMTTTRGGGYLAIDGTVLINTTSSGTTTSANVTLEAGKKYSITVNMGRGSNNSLVYAINGGSNLQFNSTQLSAPTYSPANPNYNPGSVFATLFQAVKTPASIKPDANIVATDLMANTLIATVPAPAIGLATANLQAAYANNYAVIQIPYPSGSSGSQVEVPDFNPNVAAADVGFNPFPIGQIQVQRSASSRDRKNYSWKPQTIPVIIRGVKPNTRLTLFFNQINVTNLCRQGDTYFIDSYSDLDTYPTNGAENDPIISDSNGNAVFVFRVPRNFFAWDESYEFMCVDYRSDIDQYT